jgi:RNA polymerase sigma-70 factor, ECF subfamily
MEPTRSSLLARLKSSSGEEDWETLYRTYCGVVQAYARKLGLDEHAAEDVLQETMVALMRRLPGFEYDPERGKFRNFVFTITHRAVQAKLRRAHRQEAVSLDQTDETGLPPLKESIPDERGSAPSDELELNWKNSLREEAFRRLLSDPTIKGRTLEVFKAYVLENQPAEGVAARFGISKNNVFQIKNRLVKRLQEEIQRLTGENAEIA